MLRNSTQHVCLNAVAAAVLYSVNPSGIAARDRGSRPSDVTLYVTGDNKVPGVVDRAARATVTWMFARVGVRLEWRDGEPGTGPASGSPLTIQIRFGGLDPNNTRRDALACAMPFAREGVAIYVNYDRIHWGAGRSNREAPILAHVLAHEIGHVLQSTNAHAPAGVMKAHWNARDFQAMVNKPLEFTRVDIDLIGAGLNLLKTRTAGASPEALRHE